MKAEQKRFLDFLAGHNSVFTIPVYQRNYDWRLEQCKQLFDDIVQITKEEYRTHFMGAIVAYDEQGYGGQELLIIDGQQRLTTLSLLLLAMYRVLQDTSVESSVTKEEIHQTFLINRFSQDQSQKIRLKPIKDDRKAYNAIFEGKEIDTSNITINHKYFYDRVLEQEITIDQLYQALGKLIIVEIMLRKGEDDPQLIFESLNSTGLDLTEADKVRNYILMKESPIRQETLYETYRYPIEKNTGYQVSEFLRDYLTYIQRKIPKRSKVYKVFKEYITTNDYNTNIDLLLGKLLSFSNYYKIITNATHTYAPINIVLKRINKLEMIVVYPFLLGVFDQHAQGNITEEDIRTILLVIESYIFRRFVAGVPTNSLNKTFAVLSKDISSHEGYEKNYLEVFTYVLLQRQGSQRFPSNEEFSSALTNKDLYTVQSRNKIHLLHRLEEYDNRESDIERLIEEGILTIEHIMPQTLTKERKVVLGENYQQNHEIYLHTLGNLTLTGYNSKYSNKSFIEKKTIEKGFDQSQLYLNMSLRNLTTWDIAAIKERSQLLADRAIQVRKFPENKYIPKKDESKLFTLSDDKIFTGETIVEYEFDNSLYKVESWKEMYEGVITSLFEKDPSLMYTFTNDDELSTKFFKDTNTNDGLFKIGDGLRLKVHTSTESKLYTLRRVFKKYTINTDDLNIYIS